MKAESLPTDDAAVKIVGPAVTIVNKPGGSAASQVADGETYATEDGTDNVVYKYVVTNTGDTPLTITSLSDDKRRLGRGLRHVESP